MKRMRCDLHVHSVRSTDSGNYALRRARLGESYTAPERVYDVCRARGMSVVTISDHNTLEGALRIADRPGTFLSVEVTTRFPEDDLPLHVLVWNLTEEDHRDLQPWRPSVYELVAFLHDRGLAHALAHPLYRMGSKITKAHVERMIVLFGTWEGRNGARPSDSNELACRIARAVTPKYLHKLAERHGLEPRHPGTLALTGGSDDHGGLDIATTWTEAPGETVDDLLTSIRTGDCAPGGDHGSALKLAHAVGSLLLNAYRERGELPPPMDELARLFDEDGPDVAARHREIDEAVGRVSRLLSARAREGGIAFESLPGVGGRLGTLLLAGAFEAPFIAALRHHAGTRTDVRDLETWFFGNKPCSGAPRALVFTDTFEETNGVAGTMRRLAAESAAGTIRAKVVVSDSRSDRPGVVALEPEWSLPLPGYESIVLHFPSLSALLARVEQEDPDVIHVATPGPLGLCGLAAAKLLGIPLVGSYHTELGAYALHLTRDQIVAEATELYVDWFYRQCKRVLAPTLAVGDELAARGFGDRLTVWGRGVDSEQFSPEHRSYDLRTSLLQGGEMLLLSVGRVSPEKRIDQLVAAFTSLRQELPGLRLVVAGDGPARAGLEGSAPAGVRFLGEVTGPALSQLYASADVFCFPSTTDTFGQVLIEAGASGLPVVAAAAGGGAELVRHMENGLLFPPEDVVGLEAALRLVVTDHQLRARLAAGGRSAAASRSWPDSLAELQAAYTGIARPRPSAPPVERAAAA
jgi:glycosyltransferase involved in cell wall biosynthesis